MVIDRKISCRNDFIDLVKGVLITLVCIGHTNQFLIHQNEEFWQDPLFKAIYMFHMPLFMAVAGFLSFHGISAAPSLAQYVTRRSFSYLLPIFTWAVGEEVVKFIVAGHPSFGNLPVAIVHKGLSSLWFLWALVGSIILTSIAHRAEKYRVFAFAGLFALLLALPDKNPIFYFKYTFPFFVGGFYCATINLRLLGPAQLKFYTFLLTVGSWACYSMWEKNTFIYVTKMELTYDNIFNIGLRWLSGGIVSVWFLLALFYVSSTLPERVKKVLAVAGRGSIYVYILQTYAILLLFRIAKLLAEPVSSLLVGGFLSVVIGYIVMIICLLAGTIISKNKYGALVLFGRTPRCRNYCTGVDHKQNAGKRH